MIGCTSRIVPAPCSPGSTASSTAARRAGALGAALSGAGPSVLGVAPAGKGAAVARALADALEAAGHAGRGHVLSADARGAHVERLPE